MPTLTLPRRGRAAARLAVLGSLVLAVTAARAEDPSAGKALAEKAALDKQIMAEIKDRSEIMKNLGHLSDVIGPRLTGSARMEQANRWTAEKMKEYGLTN